MLYEIFGPLQKNKKKKSKKINTIVIPLDPSFHSESNRANFFQKKSNTIFTIFVFVRLLICVYFFFHTVTATYYNIKKEKETFVMIISYATRHINTFDFFIS